MALARNFRTDSEFRRGKEEEGEEGEGFRELWKRGEETYRGLVLDRFLEQ